MLLTKQKDSPMIHACHTQHQLNILTSIYKSRLTKASSSLLTPPKRLNCIQILTGQETGVANTWMFGNQQQNQELTLYDFFAGYPLQWDSTLQTMVSLSTTEAEYIALSKGLREMVF